MFSMKSHGRHLIGEPALTMLTVKHVTHHVSSYTLAAGKVGVQMVAHL